MITHLDLFSGIGGMSLAAESAGIFTVGFCEFAEYPTKVLEKHWPDIPKWRDIRTLTGESFYEYTGRRTVDVISGGFPCQPFSVAGKRRGKDDDRYLWPEMLRVIQELRPTWVVGENVAGIVKMALDTVLFDLESIGYATQAFIIPACAVDASHRRDRCAIVAYADSKRCNEFVTSAITGKKATACGAKSSLFAPQAVAYSQSAMFKGDWTIQNGEQNRYSNIYYDVSDTDDWSRVMRRNRELSTASKIERTREDNGGRTQEYVTRKRWTVEPRMGRVVDGIPTWLDGVINGIFPDEPNIPRIVNGIKDRVNRLKCLGNAVVPAQFYPIFKAIAEIENGQQAD